ncbi:MAG: SURF1 family protein [Alphaproteobacteria bacterium]|nr:SURF1 family protein [Alphaproteobacteria bacterium]
MPFVKPRPIPLLFFISALIITLGLGTWQVQRLKWKEHLIADIERAKTEAPLAELPPNETLAAHEFERIRLSGWWVKDTEFHVTPRYFRDTLGYHIFAPLRLKDGRIVIVNRGWVPAKRKEITERPESAAKGHTSLVGMIRIGADRNRFTPASNSEKNVWFGRDTELMAIAGGLENVAPVTVDVIGTQDPKQYPIPFDGEIKLYNQHLSYIVTWYGIALGILVIFLVYHYKR